MNLQRSDTPLTSSQWLPLADVLLVLIASSTLLIPLHQWFSKPSMAPVLLVEIPSAEQIVIQGRASAFMAAAGLLRVCSCHLQL